MTNTSLWERFLAYIPNLVPWSEFGKPERLISKRMKKSSNIKTIQLMSSNIKIVQLMPKSHMGPTVIQWFSLLFVTLILILWELSSWEVLVSKASPSQKGYKEGSLLQHSVNTMELKSTLTTFAPNQKTGILSNICTRQSNGQVTQSPVYEACSKCYWNPQP